MFKIGLDHKNRQYRLCPNCKGLLFNEHPKSHTDHDQVLRQRNKAQRHVRIAAHAGASEFALVDVNGLVHRNGTNPTYEQHDGNGYEAQCASNHKDTGAALSEGIDFGIV